MIGKVNKVLQWKPIDFGGLINTLFSVDKNLKDCQYQNKYQNWQKENINDKTEENKQHKKKKPHSLAYSI